MSQRKLVSPPSLSSETRGHPTSVRVRHEGERVTVICVVVDGESIEVEPLRWCRDSEERRHAVGGRAEEDGSWHEDTWPDGLRATAMRYAKMKAMRGEVDGIC